MSAVLSSHAAPQADVSVRLAFQKQLQAVTNKIHATSNIDEIMLEVGADICVLFNADAELKSLNPNLRFLQEVDKRTGYRTKQMLVTPIVDGQELIGVIQIINNKARVPFGPLAEDGVGERAQTLAL